MTVRSALIQASATADKESTVEKHLRMIEEAARRGAQIVCLQELFTTLYFPQVVDNKWYALAEPIPGPTISTLADAARSFGLALVAPIFETTGAGNYYNSAAIIDADGKLLGVYRKNHIPLSPLGNEKFYFRPGNLGYPVFQTSFAKIGVLICYDRQFPEAARMLALRGAEIMFMPAATFKGLVDHLWYLGQRMHAAANQCFVGSVNRVGVEELGPSVFYGGSHFCDPRGTLIAQASETEEEVLVADLDLQMIAEVRTQRCFYRDRRPDTYQDLVRTDL